MVQLKRTSELVNFSPEIHLAHTLFFNYYFFFLKRFDSYLDDDKTEVLLQLKFDQTETSLLGTSYNGFIIWDLKDPYGKNSSKFLKLPHGIRNISTRVLVSNSFMISASRDYAVAGVR